jgi:hypothetical protein
VEILFLLYYSKEELNKSEILSRLERAGSKVTKYNVDSFIEWALYSPSPPLIIQTLRPDGWPKYSADRKAVKAHLKKYATALPEGDDPLAEAA